jgi:hypothetical protein
MWVEAILAKSDLDKAIGEFCPLKIKLGEDGNIRISDPRGLELVPDVGLRMSVTIEVHWPIWGIQIPVSVRSMTLEVKPEILKAHEGDQLTFKLRLDDVDISILPEFIDRTIVDRVNKELEARHVELSWNFIETLSHVFELPDALVSARAIGLRAGWGSVKITSEAIVLAISFEASVTARSLAPPLSPIPVSRALALPDSRRRPIAPESIRRLWRRSPLRFALVVGGALLAGAGMSALVLGRRRPRSFFEPLHDLFGA